MAENSGSPPLPTNASSRHKWTLKSLSVDAIRVTRRLQPREVPWDDATVKAYAAAMRSGDTFPPLLVAKVRGGLYLVDGFHRLAAAQRARLATVQAFTAPMDESEAALVAIHANSMHGKGLTNADKRRAFDLYCDNRHHLRPDGTVKSLRKIAQELRRVVSHTSVRTYLREANIEPGEASADDMPEGSPWRAPGPLQEAEMIAEAASQVRSLRSLCDQLSDPEALSAVLSDLTKLTAHLQAELGQQPNPLEI